MFNKSNSVDISAIFKLLKLNIVEEYKSVCPFSSHTDGTPSFKFYPKTNSFYCFGCKRGGGPIDFWAYYKDISKKQAAENLLFLLDDANKNLYEAPVIDIEERSRVIYDFSSTVRDFIHKNKDNETLLKKADYICLTFDTLYAKHTDISLDGLKSLINKLKLKLVSYGNDTNIRGPSFRA